ncbi:MAG TPA: 2-phospho-L-lactate guanylyltransferase [Chloroflexota bacterium]|nr:2-phospho-L-lactate guanylyltransferase [Chloroflexota bacterium]
MVRREAVWAVIVARVGNGAKSRLAGALSASQRRELALAMLADVVAVCVQAGDGVLDGTLAVVDSPAARLAVERGGAIAVLDPGTGDMNAAVVAGVRAARERGATTAMVVPGDVPLIAVSDFERLLDAAGPASRAVIVGASHDGEGTNALLLRPPEVIFPGFGPPSLERHLQAGRRAGAFTRACTDLGLSLDVDTPADLAILRSSRPGRHTAAALADVVTSP